MHLRCHPCVDDHCKVDLDWKFAVNKQKTKSVVMSAMSRKKQNFPKSHVTKWET